jgi:hypothetical protein
MILTLPLTEEEYSESGCYINRRPRGVKQILMRRVTGV